MDISNKTLAVLLLAAIVISLGGTIVSLNKLSSTELTGRATATGKVNLSVEESNSITTIDGNLINFGNCVTNNEVVYLDSELQSPNCSGYDTEDPVNISVRNDGNVHVNVTIKASAVGESQGGSFLASPSVDTSWLAYKGTNVGLDGNAGGCGNNNLTVTAYTNFSAGNTEELLCINLTTGPAGSGANSIVTNYKMLVPADAVSGVSETTITFTSTKLI